jgi:hypothetical protein
MNKEQTSKLNQAFQMDLLQYLRKARSKWPRPLLLKYLNFIPGVLHQLMLSFWQGRRDAAMKYFKWLLDDLCHTVLCRLSLHGHNMVETNIPIRRGGVQYLGKLVYCTKCAYVESWNVVIWGKAESNSEQSPLQTHAIRPQTHHVTERDRQQMADFLRQLRDKSSPMSQILQQKVNSSNELTPQPAAKQNPGESSDP